MGLWFHNRREAEVREPASAVGAGIAASSAHGADGVDAREALKGLDTSAIKAAGWQSAAKIAVWSGFGVSGPMTTVDSLFVTRLYRAALSEQGKPINASELEASCWSIAEDDEAGQDWCDENGYPGYTSYASLTDLPYRFPIFKDLVKVLNKHVKTFAKDLEFNLDGRKLKLEDIWINILPPGGIHTSHIHPHSVISGTTYVTIPEGASAIKFEDPRLQMMMAAPARKKTARPELRAFHYIQPRAGEVLLWESWLRHEVPLNMAEEERISISFNYSWN